jgi:hypothetical protein
MQPVMYWMVTLNLNHRNHLDERLAQCGEFYLKIYNTHKRETNMSPAGFKPVIPATSFDGAANGIGVHKNISTKITPARTQIISFKDLFAKNNYGNGIHR